MTRVAFLGQGHMGVPMSRRLVEAGYPLTIWNRTRSKCEWATGTDARIADTPNDAIRDAGIVITMLRDAASVDAVLFDAPDAGGFASGAVLLEMSTIGPAAVHRLRARVRDDVALLDAPVIGSVPQAAAGQLRILVGGAKADLDRSADLLGVLGAVDRVGDLGAGAAAKLVANLITITTFAMVGEALTLSDQLGLSTERALDLLDNSAISAFMSRFRPRIGVDDFPTQFGLGLAEKDLGLAVAAGLDQTGIAAAARAGFAAAVAAGLADRDISAVIGNMRSRANNRRDGPEE